MSDQRTHGLVRTPPDGRRVRNVWHDLPYQSYRWALMRGVRYAMSWLRFGTNTGIDSGTVTTRMDFNLPQRARLVKAGWRDEGLRVRFDVNDVIPLKRTAYAGDLRRGYEKQRWFGGSTVEVELRPSGDAALRRDGFYDGDTLLTVTYHPGPSHPSDQTEREPIVLIDGVSLAVLRDASAIPAEVWEAATQRLSTTWDLADSR